MFDFSAALNKTEFVQISTSEKKQYEAIFKTTTEQIQCHFNDNANFISMQVYIGFLSIVAYVVFYGLFTFCGLLWLLWAFVGFCGLL